MRAPGWRRVFRMGGVGELAWGWSRSFVRVLAPVALVWAGLAASASAEECANARFRTGPSASLPDCRAYELVTPVAKGGSPDLFAFGRDADQAIPAPDGERIAVHLIFAKFEPNSGSGGSVSEGETSGSSYVFSRGASGWQMTSVYPKGSGQTGYLPELFAPELTEVGVAALTSRTTFLPESEQSFGVGVSGGPYTPIATTPTPPGESEQLREGLVGASADLSRILLRSADSALSSAESERIVAEGTVDGALNLYEWVEGQLRLVNLTTEGALVSSCGAMLGDGEYPEGHDMHRAVSEDGSKIFFTAPESGGPEASSCQEPAQLYMRVGGSKTVDVSAPAPGVHLTERLPVVYDGASADGSKVFFSTEMRLTKDAQGTKPNDWEFYEYDTEAPEGEERLKRISRGEEGTAFSGAEGEVASGVAGQGEGLNIVISEDGSTVYFMADGKLTSNAPLNPGVPSLYRYDTSDGSIHFVASVEKTSTSETMYTTPNGEFLLFPGHAVVGESRGAGHDELYRYDNADGGLMCVSCGSSNAPAEGETTQPSIITSLFQTQDDTPELIPMSNDGGYVFFDTTARLVPQDTNGTETSLGEAPGQDVYEWEAEGTGGCELTQGCTHLITSGESETESGLLGASANGSNVFFATHANLVAQDTDGYGDIYDARIGGGFPAPPPPPPVCSSCQGVGSPPPLFSTPSSVSFVGAANPTVNAVKAKLKPKKKKKKTPRRKKRQKGKSKAARRDGGRAGANREGGR
jgi:hypothetical protein